MRRSSVRVVVAVLLVLAGARGLAAQQDAQGSKDHPLFSRMPGFFIRSYEEKESASKQFASGGGKTTVIEGRFVQLTYDLTRGLQQPSGEQIIRNFANATRTADGEVLVERVDKGVFRLTREGKEVWAEVDPFNGGLGYKLTIVEREVMRQDVVANAEAWLNDIRSSGHAAVYGVLFDSDRAEIKPESRTALVEMARLLQADPTLKVYIVGHTDGTGTFDHNFKLSQDRATAVVNALVSAHGISAARLEAHGVGPLAPVGSNATEEGRAKNRRVEIVAR